MQSFAPLAMNEAKDTSALGTLCRQCWTISFSWYKSSCAACGGPEKGNASNAPLCGSFEALVEVPLILITVQQQLLISIQVAAVLRLGKRRALGPKPNIQWAQLLVLPLACEAAPVTGHAASSFAHWTWYREVELPAQCRLA